MVYKRYRVTASDNSGSGNVSNVGVSSAPSGLGVAGAAVVWYSH